MNWILDNITELLLIFLGEMIALWSYKRKSPFLGAELFRGKRVIISATYFQTE